MILLPVAVRDLVAYKSETMSYGYRSADGIRVHTAD